jgi:hypothetical protein
MEICPRPEEWVNLDDERKARLRQVIDELRSLGEMGVSKVSGNC